MKKQEVVFMSIATEVVMMRTGPNITDDMFVNIVEVLEREFHTKQTGFINTELLHDDESESWIMIQHWDSIEHLKAASEKMFQDEKATVFVKALDPASVKMSIAPQIKVWGKGQ